MTSPITFFGMSPQLLKLISILVLAGAALTAVGVAAWSWRGSIAEVDQAKAVTKEVDAATVYMQGRIDEERKQRAFFQELAESKLVAISRRIEGIRTTQAEVNQEIALERQRNKEFYDQKLPPAGRSAWLKARNSAVYRPDSPASAASAP